LDNLSANGLFIRTSNPKPIGTQLHFEFLVRDGGAPIVGDGIVRWVEKNDDQVKGMGIQFTKLNEEGKEELRRLLHEKAASHQK
jgi:uncharacterized protein (TIGR02266 family)